MPHSEFSVYATGIVGMISNWIIILECNQLKLKFTEAEPKCLYEAHGWGSIVEPYLNDLSWILDTDWKLEDKHL